MLPVPLTVFLDANVLYSRCLRDWLVMMALDSGYTAFDLRWSEAVLAEAFYHLRRNYPDAPERRIERWREKMDENFPQAKVTHWDPQSVPRPADPNDHHVLAAAYAGQVDFLITCDGDVANFQRCLDEIDAGITVLHVDDFLCMIAERYPELVRRRYLSQVMYFQHRDRVDEDTAADSSLESLEKAGAKRFSFLLRTDERFRIW
ncbi:PIN domain-containing protein (plasmid) [Actinoplanes sp. CA-051413]|uniref:PIN domain-containing protein n=1 Tax=Actinoplanes sp. CA-051413 TaxID=3239899 RepID=UPI003D95BC6A